ncbi:hypothetical protein [Cupriavidus sp. UYPR2.512]|uniref:hypothetical protein n=1 Tax=Cupriavidus sp. UYPR2.512 TaxID=1080187 RepID=UPI000369BD84|nr:hypothetical protein [Cupriavidus sp. UYPR2.512]UIF89258.1 hypothetical protein KAF44_30230 [Cupriavidus necator]
MLSVLIDGVEYVPKAEIPVLTDERLRAALGQLVAMQYFKEHHKAVAQSWNVLQTLSPQLAELAAEDPKAAYHQFFGIV